MEIEKTLQTQVGEILEEIRFNKDIGVKKYNLLFDKNPRENFRVTRDEIVKAYKQVDVKFIEDLKIAAKNIERFAKAQKNSFNNEF